MISILHKKDLNKVTPNEISNKIIARDQFQVGIWAKKQESIAFATKNFKHSSTLARTRSCMRKKAQDQAMMKKMRKVMSLQRKICMHLEQVTNHVTTNTKLASRPRSKETSFKFFK
jgi:hypothetical protein